MTEGAVPRARVAPPWWATVLACLIVCAALLSIPFWRYDALPAEKAAARSIERVAFGAHYNATNADYCISRLGIPACTPENFDTLPPGSECFTVRCNWGHVTQLGVPGGQLTALPAQLGQLPGLLELSLRGNHLSSISLSPGQLRSVRKLDLSDNELTSLPPEISQLTSLVELDLSGNRLTSLPPELGQLPNLQALYLSGNPLSGPLPAFLTRLPLRSLTFGNTGLCVPVDAAFQSWLQAIVTSYPRGSAPYTIKQLCDVAEPDRAALLALYEAAQHPADWDLNSLPCLWPGVGCDAAGHVVLLDLARRGITRLPPEIGKLERLEYLGLGYNALTELPPEIGGLHSLARLYVQNNQLRTLPAEIGELRSLRELTLASNRLTHLPLALGSLNSLQFLDVSDNPLAGPLPLFLTAFPRIQFVFSNTDYCIPNDPALLNWMRSQATGYYVPQGDQLVLVTPDVEAGINWYLKNRPCP